MIHINDNYLKLPEAYLFSDIAHRVDAYCRENPEARIIKLGIGDVTLPLCGEAVKALHRAVDEEGDANTFHGYGPEQGYESLRRLIAQCDYRERGVAVDDDEIFVSDGAKSDTGNIGDILSLDSKVAVTDPVYPVYVDTNIMSGRPIEYLPCTESNGFVPDLPKANPDIIYLCYPNNPTGTTLTRDELKVWVDYCHTHGALLLFDAAYEAYITESDVPHSVYEIDGAKECAIEFRSFSKTAGFTGVRLGYTVVPKALKGVSADGKEVSLNNLWRRRQTTKFNGASYLSQRAAAALYTDRGRREVRENIGYYLGNAREIRSALTSAELRCVGGINSPYVWVKCPSGLSSWEFFDLLLRRANVVGTPGCGFGHAGEGWLRLTAFNTAEATREALERISAVI